MAAQWAGYTVEQYASLPGSPQWTDGIGDCKSDVVIRHRIYQLMEALKQDDLEKSSKPRGKR